jgi:LacI family transcriptional regulator
MEKKQITIKDIAKALNISASTVSRSLNDHPDISDKTKEEVREFAKEHKYQPNSLALSLRTSKNKTIGVIIPEIVHYFFSSVLAGITSEAEKSEYNILFRQSGEDYEREKHAAESLVKARVAGVLASVSKTTTGYDHFQKMIDNNIPIVFFDRICKGILTDKVVVDDYHGAFSAVDYLIKTGCKRIAYLGSTSHLLISNNRRLGYEDALRKHKISIDKSLMKVCDTLQCTKTIIPELFGLPEPPDAFFAINDETAAGVLNMVKAKGLRVPEDISICGFTDGYIPQVTDPMLTSVNQHGFEVGATAMRLLIKRLENAEDFDDIVSKVIKTNLVVRESTRPLLPEFADIESNSKLIISK